MPHPGAVQWPAIVPSGAERPRALPEEVPVALVHNGSTTAVMMATPTDLEDFALGFALSEGLANAAELGEVEIAGHADGIEARLWLPEARARALKDRRRAMAGPVGCGLCGVDSLRAATRPVPQVPPSEGTAISVTEIGAALKALRHAQPLHDETRAVHAAGLWQAGRLALVREDVGRHNALDKLIGAMIRGGHVPLGAALVLTSRISLEMVQKAAMAGLGLVVSVSAPTAAGVRLAQSAGITLASHNRHGTEIFTHPHRILTPTVS